MSHDPASASLIDVSFYGDSCLLVTVAGKDKQRVWSTAHAIADALTDQPGQSLGLRTVLATYDSVFIEFDPLAADPATIYDHVSTIANDAPSTAAPTIGRRIVIPVLYGGSAGPDLDSVAAAVALSPADAVAAHTAAPLMVRAVASPVGSPMMDVTPQLAGVPRRSVPRPRLSAGSVAVAGDQCMVYAGASPGGWNVIGLTPCRLYDITVERPPVCRPGDLVVFEAIDEPEFDARRGELPTVSEPT